MTTKLAIIPTIVKVIKSSFVEVYQSFSYSALVSMISAICYLPIFLIFLATFSFIINSAKNNVPPNELFSILIWGLILSAIWNTIAGAPITTAFYSLYQNKKEGYPGFKTFFSLFWKFYRPSFTVNGLFSLTATLLFMNVMIALIERTMIMTVIGIFSLYLLLFIGLMTFYFAPLIYLNNGIKKTIKKAFLLVLDNTVITVGLMLLIGIIFVLTVFLPIFWFLIFGAILVYITDRGFNAIYDRYDD